MAQTTERTAIASTPSYSGFQAGPAGQTYNEAAFRYFLSVDRWRAERSRRPMLLVLVAVRPDPGRNAPLDQRTAAVIFAGLGRSVREVDFVGWFREGRVAGAVLAQAAGAADQRGSITARVHHTLKQSLPAERGAQVRVRVIRLGCKSTL